ncbi:MAG TPA: ABC transporter permease [Sphingobacteriaceae bacterium]|nr:ABC transporter permease [Sphingobacteriaceae bacterium]
MNLPLFIARRITFKSKRTFSRLSVRIAILGIMLGLSVMILSVAIVKGFQIEIKEKVRGFSGDIIVLKYDLNSSYENSPFTIALDTLKALLAAPGIDYAQPFASKPGIIDINGEMEGVVMKGVDKNYNWTYIKSALVSGKVIDFSDTVKSKRQILISQYTADRLKIKTGDDFLITYFGPLRKRKFEVVGIYNLGVEDLDKTYIIGDLSVIRRLNNWSPEQVGGYEIRIKDFDNLDPIANKIYENLGVLVRSYSVKEYYPEIFQWLSLLDVNTEVILILMLVVAVINMISALLIIILERANMIGILKALGSTNWSIRKVFLYNAAYLIGFGLVLGNILGVGLALFQQHTHFFSLDQASYYITFIPIQLNLSDVIMINAGTLAICLLVLIVPSMLVTRISPVKAITFK